MKKKKYQVKLKHPRTEAGDLRLCGWLVLLLAVLLLYAGIWEYPGDMPTQEECETVVGVYADFWTTGTSKSGDGWRVKLEDGEIYRITETVDFGPAEFKRRAEPGMLLKLSLWDDDVVGIYDAQGKEIHSIEQSWEGMKNNSRMFFVMSAGCGLAGAVFLGYGYRRPGRGKLKERRT